MSATPPFPPEAVDPKLVEATLLDVRNRPPPDDPSSAGCVVAIVAIVALVLTAFAARFSPLSSEALTVIAGVLVLSAVGGGLLGVFGGGFARGAKTSDAEQAVDELVEVYPSGDPGRMRDAAVRILTQWIVEYGPTSVAGFDRDEVAGRLGDALDYVKEVERVLLERDEIYPCFTEDGLGE